MQAFKKRAVEHIRWRSTAAEMKSPLLEVYVDKMRSSSLYNLQARDIAERTLPGAARSPAEFLKDMHQDSMRDHGLRDADKDHMCEQYRPLFESFPAIVEQKTTLEKMQQSGELSRCKSSSR